MFSASCFVLLWQVVGDVSAVKNAVAIISSRLRESQHRDRSHFHGRVHSPERPFDDDYVPHMNTRRSSMDGPPSFGSRVPGSNYRNNNYSSRTSGFAADAGADPIADSAQIALNAGESLIHGLYKIVAKLLSIRLRSILPYVINVN